MGEHLEIVKAHGSRNDIFLIDRPTSALFASPDEAAAFARHLCDREGPLGSDGIYFVDDSLDVPRAEFFNPDGTTAELCGNGLRCLARLLLERRGVDELAIDIGARRFATRFEPGGEVDPNVTIELPVTSLGEVEATYPELADDLTFTFVAVPNPHLITVVDHFDVERFRQLGPIVTSPSERFPEGANLSFVVPLGPGEVFVRTYERGAGPTQSCGSGIVASRTVLTALGLAAADEAVVVRNIGGPARSWLTATDAGFAPALSGNGTYAYRTVVDVAATVAGTTTDAVVEDDTPDLARFQAAYDANAARLAEFGIDVEDAS